jgi:hypothetical protein
MSMLSGSSSWTACFVLLGSCFALCVFLENGFAGITALLVPIYLEKAYLFKCPDGSIKVRMAVIIRTGPGVLAGPTTTMELTTREKLARNIKKNGPPAQLEKERKMKKATAPLKTQAQLEKDGSTQGALAQMEQRSRMERFSIGESNCCLVLQRL